MYRLLARQVVVPTTSRVMTSSSCPGGVAASARMMARPSPLHHQPMAVLVSSACVGRDTFSSAVAARRCTQRRGGVGVGVGVGGGRSSSSTRHYAAAATTAASASIVEPGPPPPVALVSFTRGGGNNANAAELGLVENGQWLWAIPSDKYPSGMTQLIEAWCDAGGPAGLSPEDALERERKGDPIPLSSVTLLPPIPSPPSVVCVGKNYLEHVGEVGGGGGLFTLKHN